jgi:hypothetical protein
VTWPEEGDIVVDKLDESYHPVRWRVLGTAICCEHCNEPVVWARPLGEGSTMTFGVDDLEVVEAAGEREAT